MMLDELQRRNYAQSTAEAYIHALKEFAAYYHRPPDQYPVFSQKKSVPACLGTLLNSEPHRALITY